MKILELRFKNLNSLYGEWRIDFTDPEYLFNGIFAMTGPTGAGKSTILDAICLALYGQTPRLGKITGSNNEIMSRQTGSCYAEVLFESQAGRFRCHWQQRRARRRADGNLQDPEHQIADANTEKPIETMRSRIISVVTEKTGMDFDRFTRSILLAQGGFDTFLKANTQEKSIILEQITGTGIYSEISMAVHIRNREERERLNLLSAEISGITLLTPEEEQEIRQKIEAMDGQHKELKESFTKTDQAIKWLNTIENLNKEIEALKDEETNLKDRTEAFQPERDRLNKAVRASELDSVYATITALRKQQKEDQEALKDLGRTLPDLEKSANDQHEALQKAGRLKLQRKEELKAAGPLIRQVRSLDQKLSEQGKVLLEEKEICKKHVLKLDRDREALKKEYKKRDEAEKSQNYAIQYMQEHKQDEWLIGGLAGVKEQFAALTEMQNEITQMQTSLKIADETSEKAKSKLKEVAEQFTSKKGELEKASEKLNESREALAKLLGDRLLREYRTEKENLLHEMAYIRKIEELEDHRAKLEDGKPCPLCGATEHPFAEGNVPVADEVEQKVEKLTKFIKNVEGLEETVKKLENAENAARKSLHDIEKLQTTADSDLKAAIKACEETKKGLKKLQDNYEDLKQAALQKLQPLGITGIEDDQIASLLEKLKARLKAWQQQTAKKTEIEREIGDINGDIKSLNAVIESQTALLAEKQKKLEELKESHQSGMEARQELYGDKNPDEEEERLNKAVAEAEEAEKQARILNDNLQNKQIAAKTQVESLKKRIDQIIPELQKEEADLSKSLQNYEFEDEKQFLEARLPREERDRLFNQAKQLDDAHTELQAKQKDRTDRLQGELDRKITDKTLSELETQRQEQEESLKQLSEKITSLNLQLRQNLEASNRIKEKQVAIEAQNRECNRWAKLDTLIGSADGKKFRAFAQGLTFELLVAHANWQLEKMTDRYLLIRDGNQPLELNVIDNYQAGEIRTIRNLSGGESFIVSLTLALGLSRMSSRKVRVDSLFLDEGFGTLDEESLETALEALAGLQQDGKLIGVISHVSAMKERIATQINVNPVNGGRSRLYGPGCSCL